MLLTKDLYVVVKYNGDTERWKDAVFTKEEAEKEVEIAKSETGKNYEIQELDDYFVDLSYSWY
jgi:hypothetical protein